MSRLGRVGVWCSLVDSLGWLVRLSGGVSVAAACLWLAWGWPVVSRRLVLFSLRVLGLIGGWRCVGRDGVAVTFFSVGSGGGVGPGGVLMKCVVHGA